MSDKENGSDSSGQKPTVPKGMKMTLMTAALLATIKIVIPVMALFSLGLMVDVLQHHVAFWAIIGTVLGFVVAALLIYLQIRKIQKDEKKKFATRHSELVSRSSKQEVARGNKSSNWIPGQARNDKASKSPEKSK